MERIEAPSRTRRKMNLSFPQPPRSGRVVMELSDVRFGYGDHPVYEHLDLVMERGEKVALVGPNGAGKSTLLKLIAGVLQPAAGGRKLGHKVELAYFAQHQVEALSPNNTVLQELRSAIPPGVEADARALLGRFLFSGDDVDKPIAVLSGGERTRVALAKLLVSPVNLLCVDEPTNHLDMWSRDVLEEALTEYTGNIVLITHDRHLIRSVAGRIVEVVDGRVTNYAGDYAYYLSKQEEAAPETPAARPEKGAGGPGRASGPKTKEQKRQEAEERGRLKGLKERVRSIEAKLEEVTEELRGFEESFAAPDVYSSGADVADLTRRYEAAKRRAARLETEWTEAVQTLESSGT
jgi:ATP-binding cassette subfamily F protein 3